RKGRTPFLQSLKLNNEVSAGSGRLNGHFWGLETGESDLKPPLGPSVTPVGQWEASQLGKRVNLHYSGLSSEGAKLRPKSESRNWPRLLTEAPIGPTVVRVINGHVGWDLQKYQNSSLLCKACPVLKAGNSFSILWIT